MCIRDRPDAYTFGQVSSSGNGLGGFQYAEGTGETIDYEILNIGDTISRVSDGAVRNDTSDLITYPFTANKIVFDDLSTQVTNKKRQMDDAGSFEYSGSPAIRSTDFQELNLLGESIVVGPELITNGDFSNGTTGWSNNPTEILTVSGGGVATVDRNGGSSQGQCYQTILTEVGRSYTVSVLVNALSNGFQVYANNGSTAMSQGAVNSTGTHYWTFTATTSATRLDFSAVQNVNGTASFDNISAKEYTWLDRSGKGNNGKVYGGLAANVAGYWTFDGVDDSIDLPDLGVDYATNVSLEAWVRTSVTSNEWNQIVCGPCGDILWAIHVTGGASEGRLSFGSQCSSPIVHDNESTAIINDGNWYHVMTTYDGANIKHYINGVLDSTFAETNSLVPSGNLRIGSNHVPNGEFMNGDIGEVRVYPRALTAAAVFQNYNATKSKYINEAPDTAPKIGPGIVYDSNLLLNYDFGNRACFDFKHNYINYNTKQLPITGVQDNNDTVDGYTVTRGGIVSNTEVAPDGSRTAVLFKEADGISGSARIFTAGWRQADFDGQVHYFSTYVKKAESRYVYVAMYQSDDGNDYDGVKFDFDTETLIDADPALNWDRGFTNVGNGWYRIWIGFPINAGVGIYVTVGSDDNGTPEGLTTTLVTRNIDAFYTWGWQVTKDVLTDTYVSGETVYSSGKLDPPTKVKNLSSTNFPGSITSATFNSAGHFEFNGTNSEIITDDTINQANLPLTYECWVRTANGYSPSAYVSLMSTYDPNPEGFWILLNPTNAYVTAGNDGSTFHVTSTSVNDGNWHHVAATLDIPNVRIYVDGVDVGGLNNAPNNIIPSTRFVRIGSMSISGSSDRFLDGDIGEARIYNRALSATEVSQNYNATRGKYGV